ncbi:MAG: 16S rRNA (cytosine(1402)-N(4))-methyltransferase RsmH [Ruminococcaceae bacterium]|nr:16S rRNA (cytosine(1402)-N(4))-methyltransferase RsmH [Oscillospiraceae bacterium]
MEFQHISILAPECMEALNPARGGIYVDCTAGGGGHSLEIARRLPTGGRLICLDRDDAALAACEKRLAEYADRVTLVKSNFSALDSALDMLGIEKIDGVMWDLGVSSYQLDEKSRGFSYTAEAPLDMRMDQSGGMSAADVVNTYSEAELIRILRDYGEEKFAPRIAHTICTARESKPLSTTTELAEIIYQSIPAAARRKEAQHPARRTFQAIRIEVNGELDAIAPSIESAIARLNAGGRAAVITFHSLEDRIVKQTFASLSFGCTCPPDFPVCVCGNKPKIALLNKKPILPSEEELQINPRSHSAKLRCAEKL